MKSAVSAILVVMVLLFTTSAHAIRIKDLASFEGIRDNQLMGYGLVVGLNNSGDSDQTKFQIQSVMNMLERMGITTSIKDNIKTKNIAAVVRDINIVLSFISPLVVVALDVLGQKMFGRSV